MKRCELCGKPVTFGELFINVHTARWDGSYLDYKTRNQRIVHLDCLGDTDG